MASGSNRYTPPDLTATVTIAMSVVTAPTGTAAPEATRILVGSTR